MCGMSSTGLPLADVNGCMYLLFLLFFVFILFALFCLLLLPASVNVSITFFFSCEAYFIWSIIL